MFAAMAIVVVVVAWSFDITALARLLPRQWEYNLREASAINIALSVGVLVASFVFAFLVQSKHPVWWVFAFGAVWAFVALFPNLGWVSRSQGPSGLRLGAIFFWGPLLVIFATLLALRLATAIQRLRGERSNRPASNP